MNQSKVSQAAHITRNCGLLTRADDSTSGDITSGDPDVWGWPSEEVWVGHSG
jgi:hypothetical protein